MEYNLLNVDIVFRYDDLKFFIPIVIGLLSFIIFWFTWKSAWFQKMMIDRFGPERGKANIIIYSKIFGGVLMATFPTIIFLIAFPETSLADLGLVLNSDTLFASFVWIIGFGALMVFLVAYNARKEDTLEQYPQIRVQNWTKKIMQGNLLGWATYLFGYEVLFRGVLLFSMVDVIGLWPAIAINVAIYSATHIPKGLTETIGAIPLGIAFCLISIQTGSIWVAVIVHIAMSWTNTLITFKRHPEMQYVKV